MTNDDRFDRLLRRAARPRDEARPRGDCLDPETLARLTEGTLGSAERSAVEAHAADCDRCLALVAAMARTGLEPAAAPQPSRWWPLRWVAPLVTAAVAIVAWVVVPQLPTDQPQIQSSAEPAVTEVAKPAEPPVTASAAPSSTAPTATQETPSAKRQPPAGRPGVRAEKQTPERERSTAGALAVPPPAAPADTRADAAGAPSVARFAARPPVLIASPDPNVRWRIANHVLERSIDGGLTWRAQPTGVEVDLLAGAAPDPQVCWIVGPSGTVLLTTDGTTWRRVASPDPSATLVRVSATSALEATVSTSDGRTYRTIDGGRTWTLQENPGPTF